MRFAKPKGLSIWTTGWRDGRLAFSINSRGRTGARLRSHFTRESDAVQQMALHDWRLGRMANLSESTP